MFGAYWDDSWHTDRGRDGALIPPHVLLYGAVAIAALVVVGWGVTAWLRGGSLSAVLRQPPLVSAGLGGVTTLAAAPIDAAWHSAFGRDGVLWSPPHMLAVAGSAMLVVGVVSGAARTRAGVLEAAAVALLLGSLLVPGLEYETDVPQFPEVWYPPVLLAGSLVAAAVARTVLPGRRVVAPAVAVYAVFRLVVIGVLALLGFSVPELPVAVLGLAVVDLPWRGPALRYSAAGAAICGLALLAAGTGLAGRQPSQIAVAAVPVMIAFTVGALLTARRRRLLGGGAAVLPAGCLILVSPTPPASAHDPGQGEVVAGVRLAASSDGKGRLAMTGELDGSCTAQAVMLVASTRACRFAGSVQVPDPGRWFVYVELRDQGHPVEAWLPVNAGRRETVTAARPLYLPSGDSGLTGGQLVAAIGLYGAIGLLVVVTGWGVRRAARVEGRRS